jgi:hypothetical protein
MGVDIHAFVEVQDIFSDQWDCLAEIFLGRNRDLNGYICGIGAKEQIVEGPKGLPDRLSFETEYEIENMKKEGANLHDFTVLSLKEVKKIYKKTKYDKFKIIYDMMKKYSRPRLIVWFDS